MVKQAEISSNTPIKHRGRDRHDDELSSSCNEADSSPASYHYSTKLRCIPPGERTSPSPSPSPAASPAFFQSPYRATTPPPRHDSPQAASSRTQPETPQGDDNDSEDGANNATNSKQAPDDMHTLSQSTVTTKSTVVRAEAPLPSPERFFPRTPPLRPGNPLAKQKAFMDPSPLGSQARPRPTQQQLDALKDCGLLKFEVGQDGYGHEDKRDGEDGEQEEDERESHEGHDGDGVVGALEPLSLTESATATTIPTTSPAREAPNVPRTSTPTANDADADTDADSPVIIDTDNGNNKNNKNNKTSTSTLRPPFHNRNSSTSSTTLAALRADARAAYDAARTARAKDPDDEHIKTTYIEARETYDAARRAYANAVMDEEDEEEALRKSRVGKGKGNRMMDKGGSSGGGHHHETLGQHRKEGYDDGDERVEEPGEGCRAAPPSPTPAPCENRERLMARKPSPLERLERSVRRMKANKAI